MKFPISPIQIVYKRSKWHFATYYDVKSIFLQLTQKLGSLKMQIFNKDLLKNFQSKKYLIKTLVKTNWFRQPSKIWFHLIKHEGRNLKKQLATSVETDYSNLWVK